ncbi:MAG TPA: hypothetical protein PK032_00740 [Candidatus Pacearchaeota archaeon]|nr:hypothetical protein [Candidatus Pacearchaeota archaeon]
MVFVFSSFVSALPTGANVTNLSSTRAPADDPTSAEAIAGNVTELSIFGYSLTQSWQGYFGNVSGTIMLADGNDNVMYNWSLASPEGEIYATNSSSVEWQGIQCYDEANNMTFFENMFGIKPDDVDGINETFNLNDHPEFVTNSILFTAGSCDNTKLFDSNGVGTFDEVLLTDGSNLIFTSLLLEDANGFDNVPHDFEMIVLENGHGTDIATTTYYFWVELE